MVSNGPGLKNVVTDAQVIQVKRAVDPWQSIYITLHKIFSVGYAFMTTPIKEFSKVHLSQVKMI